MSFHTPKTCNSNHLDYREYLEETTHRFMWERIYQQLITDYMFVTTNDTDEIYWFDVEVGYWKPHGECLIRTEMVTRVGRLFNPNALKRVIEAIKGATSYDRPEQPNDKIRLQNGIYNISKWEMETYGNNPDYFFQYALPIKFDVEAKCQKFIEFIKNALGNEKEILTLQEFIGYVFYPLNIKSIAFIFLGETDTGKTTFVDILCRLIGDNNVAHLGVDDVFGKQNRFATSTLMGSLLCNLGDMPIVQLPDTGLFREITGGGSIRVEEKGKPQTKYRNFAKLIATANVAPKFKNMTNADYKRLKIFKFMNMIPKEKQNPKLAQEIIDEEASGIFNWAMEGLKRLLQNGSFTSIGELEEQRIDYDKQINSHGVYSNLFLEHDLSITNYIDKATIYKKYKEWCEKELIAPVSQGELSRRIAEVFGEDIRASRYEHQIEIPCFIHLKWRPLIDVATEQ